MNSKQIYALFFSCLAEKLTKKQAILAVLIYWDLLKIIGKPEPIRDNMNDTMT